MGRSEVSKEREEWVIAAPRKKVWDLLANVYAWPKWMPGVARIGDVKESSVAIDNAHYEGSTEGFPLKQELSVDEVVLEEKLVITRRFPGISTTSTYELSDDPSGGTKISRTIKTCGALSPLAGVVNFSEKSDIDIKLNRLLGQGKMLESA